MNKKIDISKYLQFLEDEGWSELIDSRWKEGVGTKVVLRECPDCVADAAEFLEEELTQ